MNKSRLIPIAVFAIFTIIIFYKFFLFGLVPIPTNLLVSFYFPWNAGGWEGFDPFTTNKEFIGVDAIRQHLPWLKFSFDQIKSGHLPIWDPYSFSGNPNIANIQSFIFYPLNFLFLIFPLQFAWSLLIILQVFLGQLFMYLFFKKLKISEFPAILASLALVSTTYFIYNLEINIIGHTLIWLPLLLYSFESFLENFKFRYFILAVFCITSIFLAGHPQTAILTILFFAFYTIYKYWLFKKIIVVAISVLSLISGFFISSFVVLPTIYLFTHAPLRDVHPDFEYFLIPFKNLLTLFAPDLYGNPATHNFFSRLYGDGTPNVGLVVFFFAILSLFYFKDKRIKFFGLASAFFILTAISTPIADLIKETSIPVLSSSNMSRNSSMAVFSLCVLAAMGLDAYLKDKNRTKKFILVVFAFGAVYAILWLYSAILPKTGIYAITYEQAKIFVKNLIIPTGTFAFFVIVSVFMKQGKIYLMSIILLSFLGYFYQFNKTLPFSKKEFFFPNHPVLDFIKQNISIDRFYGQGGANLGTNFSSYYQVYSPEGYSLLRSKRYAELIASSYIGSFNNSYSRSDAEFPEKENGYRKKIFDFLGVKYFLDNTDYPESYVFPGDEVKLIWQNGKFRVYEREEVLPRIFLTNSYQVVRRDEIFSKMYDKNFNPRTILLEKSPLLEIPKADHFSVPQVKEYLPSKIAIETNTAQNSLLFISDAYYPRWKAEIDGQDAEVLVADYALRAVAVPVGNHEVVMKYESILFPLGLFISIFSIGVLSLISLYTIKNKKF